MANKIILNQRRTLQSNIINKWLKSIKKVCEEIYVVIFVCLSTKAVLVEVVTVLASEAFVAALHRFVLRRRLPTHRLYTSTAKQTSSTQLKIQVGQMVIAMKILPLDNGHQGL